MSITVDWYNAEKTAIIYTYDGPWTWNDFDTVVTQGNMLIKSVPYIVHVVVDLKDGSIVPTDVISASGRERITNMTPPNHGKLIVYRISPAIHFLASTVERIAPQWVAKRNVVFAYTPEEIDAAIQSDSSDSDILNAAGL